MKRMILPLMFVSVSSAGAQTASIQDVAWLQGCWELRDGDRVVEERWTPPRAGSMLGVGRTTRSEKLVEARYIVLTERDGRLAYEAHPSGQTTTTFVSQPISGRRGCFRRSDPRLSAARRLSEHRPWAVAGLGRRNLGGAPATCRVRVSKRELFRERYALTGAGV